MNEKINQNWPEFIKHLFNEKVPFLKWMEIKVTHIREGYAQLEMTVDSKHGNTSNILHGGITATLMDTVIGASLRTLKYKMVTLELTTLYHKPVTLPNKLTATGEFVTGGKTILHGKAELKDQNGQLVASAKAIYYITGDDDGVYPINS